MLYRTRQIAAAVGLTPRTVRTYLRARYPAHERGAWWILEREQYESAVEQLRAAAARGTGQPMRELRRPQLCLF